jgi:ribosome-binding ATPase YchF (GTP1/OBG family)
MKISVINIPEITPGKYNIEDPRLDQVDSITKAKKKTYVQVELVTQDAALDAEAILALKDSKTDLVLNDLEFVETRLSRAGDESEKKLLNKFKDALEKEEFISTIPLTEEEKKIISGYGLYTLKSVTLAEKAELEDINALLARALRESGYISFFTTGEKETRAWLIKKGISAWEAAGAIHSDIQKGFIRAEIISFDDFIKNGGETGAKQAGKLRLEIKNYIMQDTDLVNFRFNK